MKPAPICDKAFYQLCNLTKYSSLENLNHIQSKKLAEAVNSLETERAIGALIGEAQNENNTFYTFQTQ